MIKLIIFDWDDVFTLGSREAYFRCYHEALKKVGIEVGFDFVKSIVLKKWGADVDDVIKELLGEQVEKLKEVVDNYEKLLLSGVFVEYLSYVDGANELLKRLSKSYKLAIATGINPKLLKEQIIPKFEVPQVFGLIKSGYDAPKPEFWKPHPYLVQEILRIEDILPSEAILVGDAKGDVLMARSAGVEPIVVLTGNLNKIGAEKMNVKYIIDDVTQVETILEKIK